MESKSLYVDPFGPEGERIPFTRVSGEIAKLAKFNKLKMLMLGSNFTRSLIEMGTAKRKSKVRSQSFA